MWYSILNSPRISETPAVAGNRPTLASEEAHADFAATLRWMGFLLSGQFTTTPSRSTAAVSVTRSRSMSASSNLCDATAPMTETTFAGKEMATI